MTFRFWPAVAAGLILLTTAPAYAECKLNQIFELPVTMVGTRPSVTMYVNGKEARFMVDSGAQFSLIDPGAAAALGLKTAPIDAYVRGVGGDVQMQLTNIKSFGVTKDVTLGEIEMLVAPGVGGGGMVGLLGENFLGLADIEYDLPHGAIRMFKQEGCAGTNLGYWADGGATEVDLTHTARRPMSRDRDPNHYDPGETDRHVRAAALINDQKIIVTFDTGASLSFLNQTVAARLGVTPQSPGATPLGLGGGIGPKATPQWAASFDSFALGAERINHTRLRFGDLDQVGTDMLLGADFFLSHRVFIVNSLSKAYLSYVGGPVFRFDDANLAAKAAASGTAAGDDPKDAAGLVRRAAATFGRRDFAGAEADLTKAIAIDGKDTSAYVLRGRARFQLGHNEAAVADLDQALALDPANFDALVARGSWYARAKDMAKAKIDLEAAGRQTVADGRARLRVAGIYELAEAYPEAIAQYDAMLAADAEGALAAEAYNGRCWSRVLLRRDLDKALADCDAAHRLEPEIAAYLDSRGLAHVRRGELDRALADYDLALRLQPHTAFTLYARGMVRLNRGQKAGGEADIAAAVALEPKIAERAAHFGIVRATASSASTTALPQ